MADVRLIDANALLKECEKRQEQQTYEYCDCFLNDAQGISTEWWCVEDMVMAAHTIDAVPVVHAKWETHFFSDRVDTYGNLDFSMKCTACGFLWARKPDTEHFFRYCPNCGAKMDAEEEPPC